MSLIFTAISDHSPPRTGPDSQPLLLALEGIVLIFSPLSSNPETMAPRLNKKDLEKFLALNQQGQSSAALGEASSVAARGLAEKDGESGLVRRRRRKASFTAAETTKKHKVVGEVPPATVGTEDTLDALLAGNPVVPPEVHSLWNHAFQSETIVDGRLLHNADLRLYLKLGGQQSGRTMQAYGLRMVALGQYMEMEMVAVAKKKTKLEADVAWLSSKIIVDLNRVHAVDQLELELSKVRSQLEQAIEEEANFKHLVGNLTAEVKAVEEKMESVEKAARDKEAQLLKEIEELKMAMVKQYADGFSQAMQQVVCLTPSYDFNKTGLLKEVQDGELVDLPDDDDEEVERDVEETRGDEQPTGGSPNDDIRVAERL